MKITTPTEKQNPWREGGFGTGAVDPNWYLSWKQSADWITQNSQSGTTAQRPTLNTYAGQLYFDKDLGAKGKPIWRNKDNDGWVLADGTAA